MRFAGTTFITAIVLAVVLAAGVIPSAQAQAFTLLHTFSGVPDGAYPQAGFVRDTAGNLYGTTQLGGSTAGVCANISGFNNINGCGTVFKLTPDAKGNWMFTPIHMFGEKDGAFPGGGLIFDGAGNLYGVTNEGGAYKSGGCVNLGCGTVFELMHGSGGMWTEKVLHSFNDNGKDGWGPDGGLIMDAAGDLYGTTYSGGAYGYGAVFEVTP